jgi:hypothetical protein
MTASPDRFRGTNQRWTIDTGSLAGTAYDYAFNDDWTLTWRVIAGPEQGGVGRARSFSVQPVRSQLFLVSFPVARSEFVTATVDFASRRFVGFRNGPDGCDPMSGSVWLL